MDTGRGETRQGKTRRSTRGEKVSLVDIVADLLILATQLKNARDYGHPDLLRQRIIDIFDKTDRSAYDAGISTEVMRQAKYAMAAFIDEIILNSPWPEKDQWSARPLQYEFFQEHVAGVEFFNRLSSLRKTAATQRDLLEVYYLCLILGFEGQYKLHGGSKLKTLISELSREIEASGDGNTILSPHGQRPDEFIEMVKQGLPSWVVLVTCVTISFLLFLTFSYLINHDTADVITNLNRLLEGQQ